MRRRARDQRIVIDIDELVVDGLDPTDAGRFHDALVIALGEVFSKRGGGSSSAAARGDVITTDRPVLRLDASGLGDQPEPLARHIAEKIRDSCTPDPGPVAGTPIRTGSAPRPASRGPDSGGSAS